ncbi:MAG: excalibur calcium-binding domain-containing protein [Acidimicrobiales bacterium]
MALAVLAGCGDDDAASPGTSTTAVPSSGTGAGGAPATNPGETTTAGGADPGSTITRAPAPVAPGDTSTTTTTAPGSGKVTRTSPTPTATAAPTARPGATTPPAGALYATCDAARAAGAAPLVLGDPGYTRQLDGDGDGVACD